MKLGRSCLQTQSLWRNATTSFVTRMYYTQSIHPETCHADEIEGELDKHLGTTRF
jgi:hypothetical protein